MDGGTDYVLDEQVGFLLRKANQRHRRIFSAASDLAPQQFAALAVLGESGPTSQNLLGRLTAMDAATIQGVVERLESQGLVERGDDPDDARVRLVSLTDAGRTTLDEMIPTARAITASTLESLDASEAETLLGLLRMIADDGSGDTDSG